MGAADEIAYVYTMHRANLVTGMAIITLCVIYGRYVIDQGDSAVGTGFYAFSARYASVFANLANVGALVVIITLHDNG